MAGLHLLEAHGSREEADFHAQQLSDRQSEIWGRGGAVDFLSFRSKLDEFLPNHPCPEGQTHTLEAVRMTHEGFGLLENRPVLNTQSWESQCEQVQLSLLTHPGPAQTVIFHKCLPLLVIQNGGRTICFQCRQSATWKELEVKAL